VGEFLQGIRIHDIMYATRILKEEELKLILFLLAECGFTIADYPIADQVYEYEGGIMGSINLEGSDPDQYDGDLIQAAYTDVDGTEVIITLTKDKNNKLLDLDFWKMNFSKLIRYPNPENITILRK
jgi:hypothetical protein